MLTPWLEESPMLAIVIRQLSKYRGTAKCDCICSYCPPVKFPPRSVDIYIYIYYILSSWVLLARPLTAPISGQISIEHINSTKSTGGSTHMYFFGKQRCEWIHLCPSRCRCAPRRSLRNDEFLLFYEWNTIIGGFKWRSGSRQQCVIQAV